MLNRWTSLSEPQFTQCETTFAPWMPCAGFQDFNCVFLAPENPDDEMRRLLKTHKQSHRMLYLQGSPMSHEVRLDTEVAVNMTA